MPASAWCTTQSVHFIARRFMALVRDLIVGTLDASQYEDACRALLGALPPVQLHSSCMPIRLRHVSAPVPGTTVGVKQRWTAPVLLQQVKWSKSEPN